MVKTAEFSLDMRSAIIAKFNVGIKVLDIANEHKVSRQSIYYQINKIKKHNTLRNLKRTGPKRKTNLDDDRVLLREFKKNVFLKPRQAADLYNSTAKTPISERTIRRRLKETEFKTIRTKDVPFISKANKIKRLAFANEHIHKPIEFWRTVLWTDESSFEYNSSKTKFFVRLPSEQRKKRRPVCQKVSHGGDRLIGESFILQQDNAPCHKARAVTNFLMDVGANVLNWPPQSPDLNIIENVWSLLKRKRTVSLHKTREETISELTSLWEEISPEILQNLVDSVPRRLQKVIEAKGGYTFY